MMLHLLACAARIILRLRYRVKVAGLETITSKGRNGVLILPNHPALIDPVIMMSWLWPRFRPQAVADRDRIDIPGIRGIAKGMRTIPMADVAAYGEAARADVELAVTRCASTLNGGGNVLIYPSGHAYRSRLESIGANSFFESILRAAPTSRVVLVRMRGLWGSSFSWAGGANPSFGAAAVRGIRGIVASFLFFAPKRTVTIDFTEPDDFPRHSSRADINRYLENVYNTDAPLNTYVPYSIWERGGTRTIPEPGVKRYAGSTGDVPPATREIVMNHLRELSGVTTIRDGDHLSNDLGLDSLNKVELQAWIEEEFGFAVPDPEALQSAGDVLLASYGSSAGGSLAKLNPVPPAWFKSVNEGGRSTVPEGATIPEVFLKQARRRKRQPMAADQNRGVITYRDAVLAIMVLKPLIERIGGEYVGLMFPALSVVPVVYLATLFAGKIPVMINWTAGSRNVNHSLSLLGVRTVITSAQFVSKLESQKVDLAALGDRFLFIEEATKTIGTFTRIGALVRSRTSWRSLERCAIRDTAVVLFTSGSENLPKTVPLTHENVLTNVRDALASFVIVPDDRFIGFLPPFHSFGLTVTVVLPFAGGIRAVYHPNPTEGKLIARLIHAYRATLLVGTPTFLEGITRTAEDYELESLRLVVSGAEKCSDRLYDAVEQRWPSMRVLEGYGITECSPIVSANREESSRRGTIGMTLPSIEYAVRDVDTGEAVPPGKTGLLYVRGKSVFGGYLNYDGPSPFNEFDAKRWYRTGDLVREDNGVLVFAGRLKRFIKLGGEMISLPAIEEVLLSRFQTADADPVLAVESTPSETSPEIVLFATIPITREEANATLRLAGLSAIHNVRMVKMVERIPLLGTGKADYRALKSTLK
jgi:acyl-[acyl-carrier-protein]-phospholipid O-acyltransferase/long-chain-fatty-acid--[acyl-carrier-protein] ligase